MAGPASSYAEITREVTRIIAKAKTNDRDQAAIMVARAALLQVADRRRAAEAGFNLGDELAGILPP